MWALAVAYPIQGLIKYHGLRDKELRLPYHDSISVCTAIDGRYVDSETPLMNTKTRVSFEEYIMDDEYVVDGKKLEGREYERVKRIADEVRNRADKDWGFVLESKNDFPSNIGLGASASGFAAAAMAMTYAAGLNLTLEEIAGIARLGAASAARSIMGGYSILYADGTSEKIADGYDVNMSIIVVPIHKFKYTEDAHKDAETSPYFMERVKNSDKKIFEMHKAILLNDVKKIGMLAEADTRDLHAIAMTGEAGKIHWASDTLRVIKRVKELQEEGVPAFYSIDTGASVYVNTPYEFRDKVNAAIKELNLETIVCEAGHEAMLLNRGDSRDHIR